MDFLAFFPATAISLAVGARLSRGARFFLFFTVAIGDILYQVF